MGNITETNVFEKMKEHPEAFLSAAQESMRELIRENGQKDRDILMILHEYHLGILRTIKYCVKATPDIFTETGQRRNEGWIAALEYSEQEFNKCLEEVTERITPPFNPKREDQEMEGRELMEEYGGEIE